MLHITQPFWLCELDCMARAHALGTVVGKTGNEQCLTAVAMYMMLLALCHADVTLRRLHTPKAASRTQLRLY